MDDRESRVRAGKKLWPFLCAGWIYTPPGSNGSQRVNNAFDSSYSEVMWVGRPRDGGKDILANKLLLRGMLSSSASGVILRLTTASFKA
jgi:hypothetical protein